MLTRTYQHKPLEEDAIYKWLSTITRLTPYFTCGLMFELVIRNHRDEWLTLTLPGPSAGVSGSLNSYCSL